MKNLYVMLPDKIGRINPDIYGHFSEHIGGVFYDGLWVGEDSDVPNVKGFRLDLVEKLRALHPPVLRWPGGCFAEVYNWRDGIGPRENRPTRPNWWTYEDGRYESNAVGTHEFVTLCRLVGAEPYFGANITSMTPMDMRDWMDYCNSPRGSTALALERERNGSPEPFNVKYWGVGNETWGGGGEMTPECYAYEFRRYAAVVYDMARYLGCELFLSGANGLDANDWTLKCLGELRDLHYIKFHGYTLHYYCGGLECRGYDENLWNEQMFKAYRMQEVIDKAWGHITGYGMQKSAQLVIDEWGAWHKSGSGPSKGYNLYEQQSTMRDAVVAGINLNMFNNNCEKIRMTNVAQLVNNIHSLFLAGGKDCIVTPTYHVFDMFAPHMGGEAVRTALSENERVAHTRIGTGKAADFDAISSSASVKDGVLTLTLTNNSYKKDETVSLALVGGAAKGKATVRVLHCDEPDTVNTFDTPDAVAPAPAVTVSLDSIPLPAASVVSVQVKLA